MDGRHSQHAIRLLQEERGVSWTAKCIHVQLVMRTDGPKNKAAEDIKLGQMSNFCTAMVRKDPSFVDIMVVLFNYAGVLYQQYRFQFRDGRARNIICDTAFSDYLPTSSISTYNPYINFAQQIIKTRDCLNCCQGWKKTAQCASLTAFLTCTMPRFMLRSLKLFCYF